MFLILLVNLARSFDEVFAMPVFRSAYDGLSRSSSVSTSVDFSDSPSLAVQAAKDDCDINVIMTRFGRGVPMPVPRAVASYGDFSDVTDYQDALDGLSASEATFNALPSRIRARFGNSPGALWSFLHDSSNEEEARKLGLLEPLPVVPDPVAVRLVPEAVVVPPAAS